jgi:hypothetical protein
VKYRYALREESSGGMGIMGEGRHHLHCICMIIDHDLITCFLFCL